jgi:type IV secretion system protein VirB10
MKKFDELTGCWIDDESNTPNSENDTSPKPDIKQPEEKKENPDTLLDIEDKNPINRKLIFIVCAIIVLIVLIYTYFIPKIAKNNEKNNKVKTASDIEVPFFGSYYDSTTPENNTIEDASSNDTTSFSSNYPNNSQQAAKPSGNTNNTIGTIPQKPQAQTIHTTALSEQDLAALNASYDDYKMAKLYPGQSENTHASNTAENSVKTASEYIQDRLGDYAGLTGQTSSQQNTENSYENQNNQKQKQDFYSANSTSSSNGYYISNATIWKGTIIPAVLITAINTDTPGMVKAQVTDNVYDSKTGKILLIPQGTFLIAEYSSSISYSQQRIQIAWNTLIRPDGYQVNLGNMPATDENGMSGVKGIENDHLFEYVKAMGMITVFTALNGEFQNSIDTTANQYAQNIIAANQQATTEMGEKLIERALDIQPTLKKLNGSAIKVFTNKTIALPPMANYQVTQKYVYK